MDCTLSDAAGAASGKTSGTPSARIVVFPSALLVAFATVPDPRRRQGISFALPAILALAVAAILSNHLSLLAHAEWGASQSPRLSHALGFRDGLIPHQSTLQRLFHKLDPDQLSAALTRHFANSLTSTPRPRASQGVAIDGKAQRGRLAFDSAGCPILILSAFLHDEGIVLAQEPIDNHGPSNKVEAELTVAPDLLKRVDWHGRVMTGDAFFCQRSLCEQVTQAGGDYLFPVKENQPTLYEDIRLLFDPSANSLPLDDRREARTVGDGHGRHRDGRHLIASTELVGYSDWPALAQLFRLERTWQEQGQSKSEIHYGVTSLPPEPADTGRLLALRRGHWHIENSLHRVKDVTLGEDRSLIHSGNGPSILAMLRDLAINLLRQAGYRTFGNRLRFYSRHPEQAVALITGISP